MLTIYFAKMEQRFGQDLTPDGSNKLGGSCIPGKSLPIIWLASTQQLDLAGFTQRSVLAPSLPPHPGALAEHGSAAGRQPSSVPDCQERQRTTGADRNPKQNGSMT